MARVIVGDQQLPAKVVYMGSAMDVWIVDDIYRLFVGDHSLNITDPEATELEFDIENLDPPALEQKWLAIANGFFSSLD